MKIAVSGKGGVGKTTFASFLIRALADEGKVVLAIDADPDANLAQALGVKGRDEIVPISQMKDLIEERTEAKVGTMGFCIGGHMAYLTACETDVAAAASFYGGGIVADPGPGGKMSTVLRTPRIRGAVACFMGGKDLLIRPIRWLPCAAPWRDPRRSTA